MDEPVKDAPQTESTPSPAAVPSEEGRELLALAICAAGWAVPGLGHALQKMWGRALAVFLAVGALVILGAGMRGNVFTSRAEDAFATLGYLGTRRGIRWSRRFALDGRLRHALYRHRRRPESPRRAARLRSRAWTEGLTCRRPRPWCMFRSLTFSRCCSSR